MADRNHDMTAKGSAEAYDARQLGQGQLDDGQPRPSEEDIQRAQFGPRGVPGQDDPAKMTPQRKKKTPSDVDPGHTA